MVEKKIPYEVDGKKFEGVLVYNDALKGKRPAVLMSPDWSGASKESIAQAKLIAGTRYVVFVADMFGADYAPKSPQEMGKASGAIRGNLPMMRARINKALDTFKAEAAKSGLVDEAKWAAIGFCGGGGYALELARQGKELKAVVVFHADLTTSAVDGPGKIKSRILALQGADDPIVPKAARDKFEEEMRAAKADYQIMAFGGTMHAFTEPHVNDPAHGVQYNAKVTKASYEMMRDFFAQSF
jgi:dienelactone hydrolase